MGLPPPIPPPPPFATRRHLAAYLRRNLGEHDVSVDPDYWGDDEDAMVDLVGALFDSCRDACRLTGDLR